MHKLFAATSVAALLAIAPAIAQTPGGSGQDKDTVTSPPGREQAPPASNAQKQDAPVQKGAEGGEKGPNEKQKTSEPDRKAGPKDAEKRAEPRPTKDDPKAANPGEKAGGQKDKSAADQPKAGDTKADTKSGTAQDGTKSGKVTITSDQRQKVQTTFAKHKSAAKVSVNVDVKVGTRVPRDVRLVAVPDDIVVIVPQYRRYKYFVVEETVVIVDPDTFEIVEVIVIA